MWTDRTERTEEMYPSCFIAVGPNNGLRLRVNVASQTQNLNKCILWRIGTHISAVHPIQSRTKGEAGAFIAATNEM